MKKFIFVLLIVSSLLLVACQENTIVEDKNIIIYNRVIYMQKRTDTNIICIRYDMESSFWKDVFIIECFKVEEID